MNGLREKEKMTEIQKFIGSYGAEVLGANCEDP
jgi:hypothetical protein